MIYINAIYYPNAMAAPACHANFVSTKVKLVAVKETIAIAGATGKAGTEIARKLAAIKHRLLLIAADNSTLTQLSADIKATIPNAEAEAIDCIKDACWEADIIVLAVSAEEEKEMAQKIREVTAQKIVVRIILIKNSTSFSAVYLDELQYLLPYSKIVTVFINTDSSDKTIITGDDQEAVETIVKIATKAGFNIRTAVEL